MSAVPPCPCGCAVGAPGAATPFNPDEGRHLFAPAVAERISAERTGPIAAHESGHACAAIFYGHAVGERGVRLGWANGVCTYAAGSTPWGTRDRIAVALAGPISERWYSHSTRRPLDEELLAYIGRVREAWFGTCDWCVVGFELIVACGGAKARDEDMLRLYRSVEAETLELIQDRYTGLWPKIQRVAAALQEQRSLSDSEVRAIMAWR